MKTTLEIPNIVFRRAKSLAAERGIPLREFVTEAVKDKLADSRPATDKPWMTAFGKLRRLRKDAAKIHRLIEEEFEPRIGFDFRHEWAFRPGRGRIRTQPYPPQSGSGCYSGYRPG